MVERFTFIALSKVLAFSSLLTSCSNYLAVVPLKEEQALATDGSSISRYHFLLQDPYAQGLQTTGFIVGLEKSPRESIGLDPLSRSYDSSNFVVPDLSEFNAPIEDANFQRTYFLETFDDSKVVFLSHAMQYRIDDSQGGIDTSLLYSAYETTGFGQQQQTCETLQSASPYDRGWAVLNCLQSHLRAALKDAKSSGRPHTHILMMTMGWNNDQVVSVRRYNSLLAQTQIAARRNGQEFNPLVIGLTWPSVWGGGAQSEILRSVTHLASYSARARDADEIGFGYANAILNSVLPPLESEFGIGTVAIGHSFGARILTRAYVSAPFLKRVTPRLDLTGPLVIGLQPAFSANRFRGDHASVSDGASIPFVPTEGSPFQHINEVRGHLAVTWSKNDGANPVAQYISGAVHVGGKPGYDEALENFPEMFEFTNPTMNEGDGLIENVKADCIAAKNNNRVHYIDASNTIDHHSDIANAGVGSLVWALIDCHKR